MNQHLNALHAPYPSDSPGKLVRAPDGKIMFDTPKAEDQPVIGGRKDDHGKARLDLIPPEIMFALGSVLAFGAAKYAERNWEKGMSWGRVFGALMRHLWAWWGGRTSSTENFLFGELDAETGMSHLWHALACLAFLVAYESRKVGRDDRFSPHGSNDQTEG